MTCSQQQGNKQINNFKEDNIMSIINVSEANATGVVENKEDNF